MNLSIEEAREYLGLPAVVTSSELLQVSGERQADLLRQNDLGGVRRVSQAVAVIAVDEGYMSPEGAVNYLAKFDARLVTMTPKLDQLHAELAKATDDMVDIEMQILEKDEQLAAMKSRLEYLRGQHLDAKYALARQIVLGRMRRRALWRRVKAVFRR